MRNEVVTSGAIHSDSTTTERIIDALSAQNDAAREALGEIENALAQLPPQHTTPQIAHPNRLRAGRSTEVGPR